VADFAFVDTSFLVARFNPMDRAHARARGFMESLATGDVPPRNLVTSEFVFDETITMLYGATRKHAVAVAVGDVLRGSRTLKLMGVELPTIEEAWRLFKARGDKRWSFTDCVSFTLMEALSIRAALTFDDNFKEAGFATYP
jgi:predicted nucleic acid-binding protein